MSMANSTLYSRSPSSGRSTETVHSTRVRSCTPSLRPISWEGARLGVAAGGGVLRTLTYSRFAPIGAPGNRLSPKGAGKSAGKELSDPIDRAPARSGAAHARLQLAQQRVRLAGRQGIRIEVAQRLFDRARHG